MEEDGIKDRSVGWGKSRVFGGEIGHLSRDEEESLQRQILRRKKIKKKTRKKNIGKTRNFTVFWTKS